MPRGTEAEKGREREGRKKRENVIKIFLNSFPQSYVSDLGSYFHCHFPNCCEAHTHSSVRLSLKQSDYYPLCLFFFPPGQLCFPL